MSKRPRVLIITYYWPPSGGSGVQRWLKFTKYLRDFGWEPVIYTPENPEAPAQDESLLRDVPHGIEVIKQPIWEPYEIYKRFVGRKKGESIGVGFMNEKRKPGKAEVLSRWIRGNFFIPDARRFWIGPSVKYLTNYLSANPVDCMVSTGPPHSMNMIGLKLHQATGIPWVADFRDPWTNIDFYEELRLGRRADRKHHQLERDVLTTASRVTTVGKTMQRELEDIRSRSVDFIPNGYDSSDFQHENPTTSSSSGKFSIAHIGSLVESRNPELLWKAMAQLCAENDAFNRELEIRLIGKVDFSAIDSIHAHGLESKLTRIDYMPHKDVAIEQRNASVLLLLLNNTKNAKGILSGKFFEYMAAKRPVFTIGPEDSDVAEILADCKAGSIAGFSDEEAMRTQLLNWFEQRHSNDAFAPDMAKIEQFSRKNLTESMAGIFNELKSDA